MGLFSKEFIKGREYYWLKEQIERPCPSPYRRGYELDPRIIKESKKLDEKLTEIYEDELIEDIINSCNLDED